jgi:general secretion pathway protein L
MTMIPPDVPALLLFAEDDVGAIEGWFRVAEGRIVARGGGLTALPDVSDEERVVLVLRGPDVAIDWIELPPLTAPQAIAAARLAFAERSPSPMDQLHIAIGEVHAGRRMTATIDADLLARWIAWAQEQGLDPDHIVPLPMLIAYGEGPIRIWARHGLAYVRGHDQAFAIEADLLPVLLEDAAVETMDDARFEAELPAALIAVPVDLRQGRFARRREWRVDAGWMRRMRLYAIAAVILLACIPIARLARVAYDGHHFYAEAQRVARLALGRESLPEDPRVALRQRLTDLRGPGMGFSVGAGTVFGAVARTPNIELSGLTFDQSGMITANVNSASPADLADLVRRIGQGGLVVEILPGGTRDSAIVQVRQP